MLEQDKEGFEGETLDVFLNRVGRAIRSQLPGIYWVRAEILKADIKTKKHSYLELAAYDGTQDAKARAWIWATNSQIITQFEQETGTTLKAGLKILFQCSVQFKPEFGLSLQIHQIDSRFTLGDMEAKLQVIRNRLISLNEIDNNKKLQSPHDFTRVAVISPAEAAGLGDFKTISERLIHHDLCKFDFYPALFQGPQAVESFVEATTSAVKAHQSGIKYDALVIVRGGGDKAGLYQLNDIKIARCICRSPIPVMVGVGHERDNTIIDELANVRFATPSLVASSIQEKIVSNARNSRFEFESILRNCLSILAHAKQEINDFKNGAYKNAQRSLSNSKEKTTEYKQMIQHAPIAGLQRARHATNNINTQIQYAYRDRVSNARIESQKLIQSISSQSKLQMNNNRHLVMEYRRDVTATSKINLANIKSGVFRAKNGLDGSIKLIMHSSKISLLDYHKELLATAQSATSKQRYILRELNYKITNQSIKTLEKLKAEVKSLIERVLILDPKKVLDRGYVLVKDTNNKSIITSALSTHASQKITLEFKDGSIKAKIEGQ